MAHEFVTQPLTREALLSELSFLAAHFSTAGTEFCTVLFGFAWGSDYPEGGWRELELPLTELEAHVASVEASDIGALGDDDLFVTFPSHGLEFQLCHESDVHLRFENASPITEFFWLRWLQLGFAPTELVSSVPGASPEVIRTARDA